MSSIWNRVALALLILGVASFGIAAASYDEALKPEEMPLVRPDDPDAVSAYAPGDDGLDHDLFVGGGAAFLVSAAVVATFSPRRRRRTAPS